MGETAEIDDLRKLVKDLMQKNQALQEGRGGGADGAQVSDELAHALNALRRRVSVMDKKMDEAPSMPRGGGGGARRTERSYSTESLFTSASAMDAPASGGGKVMMDLTSSRGDDDDDDPRSSERRSTCQSMFMDLSGLRQTIAGGR